MSECKHRRKDGVCLQDLEYVYKGYCVDAPCSCYEPQTNADQIRAMSDEELARWVAGYVLNLTGGSFALSEQSWLKWLKAPVEVDNG